MIGRALNGRYVLEEILGVGGMATVWRGHDRVLGRAVAVKVLNGGLADDPRFAERFGREAQHAAMLVHPRIVTVFDSGVDQGSPYIVMELVHGRPLSRLIAELGRLPVERSVGIAAAVCEALEVAHAAELVHRDIKPGNIMITHDGGVKVVDFGIARVGSSSSRLTQTATVLGTAAYLSPEQATAAGVDGRSDLYAVGCVLVEMLTGQPPFDADTPVGIAFKHVSEQPAPVAARRPDVPPALDAAVLRLLAKQPADRPATAATARAELLAAVPVAATTDRTAELLAAGDRTAELIGATQLLPPVVAPQLGVGAADPGHADAQRTAVLPPTVPPPFAPSFPPSAVPSDAPPVTGPATSLMEAVPLSPHEASGPSPQRRRRPLVPIAIGVAVVAGVAAVGAFALSGSSGSPAGTAAETGRPAAAAPTAAASASPSPSASAGPAPTARSGPAAALAALRAEVAKAQFAKERDKQGDLLDRLDSAAEAIAEHRPQDAESVLRNVQKTVRDLAKKHVIDGGAGQNWQNRLGALINTLHGQQSRDHNSSDNNGDISYGDNGNGN
ncbi:protein kinase [Kitasatospora sp. GP82]|uniref:protein kinase domain-containing protein n=1 Tax=Kitasatospora sp. GP82 TaxID=3035089 RepID=UPI0024770927|nr:protein kinase [Kitasatospora sp. GP82]MDH6124539.1 putative Ser/Thr protein kinase [Kitasatospora sp. GP82]